jgi:HTH-type transcriptional regulator, transcriptional repressor of NAD biosynthesis genes
MRRGLVLGKFAPLHRGHQHLIETAQAAVHELVVAVYHTAWYPTPVERRAAWIRALFPRVRVEIVPDLPPDSYDQSSITAVHAADLETRLGGFTDVFTSEDYGDELAACLGARHTLVDRERSRVPTSSTAIRADAYACRQWVEPLVYRELVHKVVFLGAESTGKTTLARVLAERHATTWVPEFGRELWERKDGRLELADLDLIAREQLRLEDEAALEAREILFCDTNVLATELWSRRLFGEASPAVVDLGARTEGDYTTFLCEPDFAFEQDGTRETRTDQLRFHALVRADLHRRALPFTVLTGPLETRVATVEQALALTSRRLAPRTRA